MKRILTVVALGLMGLALSAMVYPRFGETVLGAAGFRAPSEFVMFLRLNGSPTKIGVITSAGASTTNASTATPFTIVGGDTIDILCDAAAFCIEGATASNTYTAATLGVPQGAGVDRFWLSKATTATTTFACFGAAAFNCAFFQMQ